MKKKQLYEAPGAELFVIRFEEGFLTGTYGDNGKAGTLGKGYVYDFGDDEED